MAPVTAPTTLLQPAPRTWRRRVPPALNLRAPTSALTASTNDASDGPRGYSNLLPHTAHAFHSNHDSDRSPLPPHLSPPATANLATRRSPYHLSSPSGRNSPPHVSPHEVNATFPRHHARSGSSSADQQPLRSRRSRPSLAGAFPPTAFLSGSGSSSASSYVPGFGGQPTYGGQRPYGAAPRSADPGGPGAQPPQPPSAVAMVRSTSVPVLTYAELAEVRTRSLGRLSVDGPAAPPAAPSAQYATSPGRGAGRRSSAPTAGRGMGRRLSSAPNLGHRDSGSAERPRSTNSQGHARPPLPFVASGSGDDTAYRSKTSSLDGMAVDECVDEEGDVTMEVETQINTNATVRRTAPPAIVAPAPAMALCQLSPAIQSAPANDPASRPPQHTPSLSASFHPHHPNHLHAHALQPSLGGDSSSTRATSTMSRHMVAAGHTHSASYSQIHSQIHSVTAHPYASPPCRYGGASTNVPRMHSMSPQAGAPALAVRPRPVHRFSNPSM